MKCPHCEYETGYDFDSQKQHEEPHGEFWVLPVKMERSTDWGGAMTKLYACPCCKKTFID